MSLDLFLEPEVHQSRHMLPGNIRQRIRRLLDDLALNPRPNNSRLLDTSMLDVSPEVELRRIRVERWRVIYAVNEGDGWVWVLAIRQRPPYNYDDLAVLGSRLPA